MHPALTDFYKDYDKMPNISYHKVHFLCIQKQLEASCFRN
jgi:hypothetical protein